MRAVALAVVVLISAACVALSAGAGEASKPKLTPAQIELSVRTARADESEALKDFGKGNVAAAKIALTSALGRLQPARDAAKNTPGLDSVYTNLNQAMVRDEAALEALPRKVEHDRVESLILIAILRKDQALERLTPKTVAPQPPTELPPPSPPPPPQPPPPPPVKPVPDALLAGLRGVDTILAGEIRRLEEKKPRDEFPVESLMWNLLANLGQQYLPLDFTFANADLKLGYARAEIGDARSDVPGSDKYREDRRLARDDFEAAIRDFEKAAKALSGFPDLHVRALSLAASTAALALDPLGTGSELAVDRLVKAKLALIGELPNEFGIDRLAIYKAYEQAYTNLLRAAGSPYPIAERYFLVQAQTAKQDIEKLLESAPKPPVTFSLDDSWAHNETIGKTRDCVDVTTSPPQAFISGTVTGPSGTAQFQKTAMSKDGKIQVSTVITRPGPYTWTLTVYESSGNQTGTATKLSTVASPPTNGNPITPPCVAPTK